MYGYAHATRQVQNLRVEGPVVAPLQRKNSHGFVTAVPLETAREINDRAPEKQPGEPRETAPEDLTMQRLSLFYARTLNLPGPDHDGRVSTHERSHRARQFCYRNREIRVHEEQVLAPRRQDPCPDAGALPGIRMMAEYSNGRVGVAVVPQERGTAICGSVINDDDLRTVCLRGKETLYRPKGLFDAQSLVVCGDDDRQLDRGLRRRRDGVTQKQSPASDGPASTELYTIAPSGPSESTDPTRNNGSQGCLVSVKTLKSDGTSVWSVSGRIIIVIVISSFGPQSPQST